MPKAMAFAIATQQGHKLGKTPKGYGTKEGKREARAKFDKPRKEYVKGANPGDLETPKLPREKTAAAAMRDELAKWAMSDDPYLLENIPKEPKIRRARADAPHPKYRVKEGAAKPLGVYGLPSKMGANVGLTPAKQLAQSQNIGVPKIKQPKVEPLQVKMAAIGPKVMGMRGGRQIPLEEFLGKAKGLGGRAKELIGGVRVQKLRAAKDKLQEALYHPQGPAAVMERGDLIQGMLNPRMGISQLRRMAVPVEAAMKETAGRRSQIAGVAKDLAAEELKSRAAQVGAAGVGGVALASPVLALRALNRRVEREKRAFSTNQYSGDMGPGRLTNYAAGLPPYRGPQLGVKTAGPPSEDTKPDANSKPVGKVRGFIDKFFEKGQVREPGHHGASAGDLRRAVFGWSKEDLDAVKRAKTAAMRDELVKLNGMATTPGGKLYQAQAVGSVKVTAPPGPSIADQSKPVGYGTKQPGATKSP